VGYFYSWHVGPIFPSNKANQESIETDILELLAGNGLYPGWVSELSGNRTLLFLSRIHPKKALNNLIEIFGAKPEHLKNIRMLIVGPDEGEYAGQLKKRVKELGIVNQIVWAGMLHGEQKRLAFSLAEAFILPSHQENFGQVVAEALSANCPVLISNKVNIWREILKDNAGMVCDDTVEDTGKMIEKYLDLTEMERLNMRKSARYSYDKRFSIEAAFKDLQCVLDEAIASNEALL